MTSAKWIKAINTHGALLTYPITNKKEPQSIWSVFHPKKKMRWEWDANGDGTVGDIWLMMKKVSENPAVVYSKWFQGRATFFSHELFSAMIRIQMENPSLTRPQSHSARALFECLESDSPLSTKELKKMTDLQGKLNEGIFTKGMKELFQKLLIVGFGEVDDGAFPSLAVGTTQNLHEHLWHSAKELDLTEAKNTLDRFMPVGSSFRKFFDRVQGAHESCVTVI